MSNVYPKDRHHWNYDKNGNLLPRTEQDKKDYPIIDDVLKNFDNLFLYDQYYERPNYENRLFGHFKPECSDKFILKNSSSELKEEVKKYVKENGVRFFTANDDDEGYPKNHPEYDEEYCDDRCYGYYLDTDNNKAINFEPLDRHTTPDLGHARLYAKNSEGKYEQV